MASAFSDSLMASGGIEKKPWDLENYKMTVKFLPDIGAYKEAPKKIDITGPVCKLQT